MTDDSNTNEFVLTMPLSDDKDTSAAIEVEENSLETQETQSGSKGYAVIPETDGVVILVVEDDAEMRDFITGALGERWKTLAANNGQEAIEILEKENITRENTLISITKVQCSSCLKNATVYVSVYGGGTDAEDEVIQLLESKRALIQKRIAKTIVLKYTPVLRFTADRNLEEGDRVLNILRELEEEK